VVHVQAGIHGLERDALGLAGRDLGVLAAAEAAGDGMQVDRVDRLAALVVGEVQVDGVAFLHAQHGPGTLRRRSSR
jgi:hypothetical protein